MPQPLRALVLPSIRWGSSSAPFRGRQASGRIHEETSPQLPETSPRLPAKGSPWKALALLLVSLPRPAPLCSPEDHRKAFTPAPALSLFPGRWEGWPWQKRSWNTHSPGSTLPGLRGWGLRLPGACPPSAAQDSSVVRASGPQPGPVLLLRKRLPLSKSCSEGQDRTVSDPTG